MTHPLVQRNLENILAIIGGQSKKKKNRLSLVITCHEYSRILSCRQVLIASNALWARTDVRELIGYPSTV